MWLRARVTPLCVLPEHSLEAGDGPHNGGGGAPTTQFPTPMSLIPPQVPSFQPSLSCSQHLTRITFSTKALRQLPSNVCKSLVTELLAFTPVRLQPPSSSQGVLTKQRVELAAPLCKNLGQFPISLNEIHNLAWPPALPSCRASSASSASANSLRLPRHLLLHLRQPPLCQNVVPGRFGGFPPHSGPGLTSGHLTGHGGGEPQYRPQHGLAIRRGCQRPAV